MYRINLRRKNNNKGTMVILLHSQQRKERSNGPVCKEKAIHKNLANTCIYEGNIQPSFLFWLLRQSNVEKRYWFTPQGFSTRVVLPVYLYSCLGRGLFPPYIFKVKFLGAFMVKMLVWKNKIAKQFSILFSIIKWIYALLVIIYKH